VNEIDIKMEELRMEDEYRNEFVEDVLLEYKEDLATLLRAEHPELD